MFGKVIKVIFDFLLPAVLSFCFCSLITFLYDVLRRYYPNAFPNYLNTLRWNVADVGEGLMFDWRRLFHRGIFGIGFWAYFRLQVFHPIAFCLKIEKLWFICRKKIWVSAHRSFFCQHSALSRWFFQFISAVFLNSSLNSNCLRVCFQRSV